MPPTAFGALLQRLRKAAGLRQLDLADRLGMARSTIANVEAGREPPTPRLWEGLETHFAAWCAELREAHERDRIAPRSASPPRPALGGPFVIESVAYVYLFEHSRSPSEIIEVRRVRATEDGASSFGLSMRHTAAPGFVVDEQPLWGGHLAYRELIDEQGGTSYLRTFEFGRTLRRGDRHEFACRAFVERDPTPQTDITFTMTLPVQEASIHLGFHGGQRAAQVWRFGPIGGSGRIPAPTRKTRVPMTSATASAYFERPRQGPSYGVAWSWGDSRDRAGLRGELRASCGGR